MFPESVKSVCNAQARREAFPDCARDQYLYSVADAAAGDFCGCNEPWWLDKPKLIASRQIATYSVNAVHGAPPQTYSLCSNRFFEASVCPRTPRQICELVMAIHVRGQRAAVPVFARGCSGGSQLQRYTKSFPKGLISNARMAKLFAAKANDFEHRYRARFSIHSRNRCTDDYIVWCLADSLFL
jgi:hypothetical protein